MTIAIFGNTYRTETIQLVTRVVNFLLSQNVVILLEDSLYTALSDDIKSAKNIMLFHSGCTSQADVALSIGGDGTFLTTASHIGNNNVPILGINSGHLGFLADVANHEIEDVLNDILINKYTIEQRTLLHVTTPDESNTGFPFALNEVAVLKQDLSSMISVDIFINNEHIHTYQADGLIIATPTGSTAYNMSVGGPLMVPQAKDFIISPVASHSLTVRPLVIPDDWEIRMKVKSRSHSYLVSIDGRSQLMSESSELIVRKAPYTIKVVKTESHSFFNSLKNKLMWGADSRKL